MSSNSVTNIICSTSGPSHREEPATGELSSARLTAAYQPAVQATGANCSAPMSSEIRRQTIELMHWPGSLPG